MLSVNHYGDIAFSANASESGNLVYVNLNDAKSEWRNLAYVSMQPEQARELAIALLDAAAAASYRKAAAEAKAEAASDNVAPLSAAA